MSAHAKRDGTLYKLGLALERGGFEILLVHARHTMKGMLWVAAAHPSADGPAVRAYGATPSEAIQRLAEEVCR